MGTEGDQTDDLIMESPDASPYGWWICGPADYTLRVLPKEGPKEGGHVYALALADGMVKIGSTKQPRGRIANLCSQLRNYGASRVIVIAISHPTCCHREIETALHRHFAHRHVRAELYRVRLAEIANAITGRALTKPKYFKKAGRTPKPWWWEDRKGWYAWFKGSRRRLGNTEEEAIERLGAIIMDYGLWQPSPRRRDQNNNQDAAQPEQS